MRSQRRAVWTAGSRDKEHDAWNCSSPAIDPPPGDSRCLSALEDPDSWCQCPQEYVREAQTLAAGKEWREADGTAGQQGRAGWRTASPGPGLASEALPWRVWYIPAGAEVLEQMDQEFNINVEKIVNEIRGDVTNTKQEYIKKKQTEIRM